MKVIWLAIGCMVLLVLAGIMLSRDEWSPQRQAVVMMDASHHDSVQPLCPLHQVREAWAPWLAPAARRQRQRRNPLRRYRLTKKHRCRLRRRLQRALGIESTARRRRKPLPRPATAAAVRVPLAGTLSPSPRRRSREDQPRGALTPAGPCAPAPAPAAVAAETAAGSAETCAPSPVRAPTRPRYGRKDVAIAASRTYRAELETCPQCGAPLKQCGYLSWRKTIQTLAQNLLVGSRGAYCAAHPAAIYLSAAAARLSLPGCTYGLDVLVHIGYRRDYARWTFARIHQDLPRHIQVSERHVSQLYQDYLALLACADRLDVDELRAAVKQYGGLILSIDGLEPEGGQPQLWVVREVLTDTLIAAGWLPRVDADTLQAFLAPIAALNLPLLATLSDKQAALIQALNATWENVPHQYCQAHYLSNAVDPLYEADEHMKTQLRKQVRAQAGVTMREAQAQAKRQTASDGPTLIATGLAAQPPAELAQLGRDPAPAPAENAAPALPPNVIVRQRQRPRAHTTTAAPVPQPPPAQAASRQSQIDQLVVAYAGRLRSLLSRNGRKPFRLAGLHLYADLLALVTSLESVATLLPDEPRLTCFANAIRQALADFEEEYTWLAEGYSWVLDISAILDAPLPQPPPADDDAQAAQRPADDDAQAAQRPTADDAQAAQRPTAANTVQAQLEAYLQQLQARTDLSQPLIAFREHLSALTERYAPGLFHCYAIPGLPRTNNDLESLFGNVRRRTLCTAGPYRAQQLLHDYGAWLLFETIPDQHRQLERLRQVSVDDFRQERQCMQHHREERTADLGFRRHPSAYLARLEAQAETIARLE